MSVNEKQIKISMMNAVFFQSRQFVSVAECINSYGDNTKEINLRPFMNVRPELNGFAFTHLHPPC